MPRYAYPRFYSDTPGLGEIAGIGGMCWSMGAVPQRDPGAEPLIRGLGSKALPEAESFLPIVVCSRFSEAVWRYSMDISQKSKGHHTDF